MQSVRRTASSGNCAAKHNSCQRVMAACRRRSCIQRWSRAGKGRNSNEAEGWRTWSSAAMRTQKTARRLSVFMRCALASFRSCSCSRVRTTPAPPAALAAAASADLLAADGSHQWPRFLHVRICTPGAMLCQRYICVRDAAIQVAPAILHRAATLLAQVASNCGAMCIKSAAAHQGALGRGVRTRPACAHAGTITFTLHRKHFEM